MERVVVGVEKVMRTGATGDILLKGDTMRTGVKGDIIRTDDEVLITGVKGNTKKQHGMK